MKTTPKKQIKENTKSKEAHPVKKNKENSKRTGDADEMRLNKYIAHAGICSRREADKLIESGNVSINGVVVTELGTKVNPGDKVSYDGKILSDEKKVYLLLNKPKDYITTSTDPYNRKTVLSLIANACRERVYPVGRLDRMTTGLLLLTNDGELAKKLTHPRHRVRKLYHASLDRDLTKSDMIKIISGITLEDGVVDVDKVTYIGDGQDKKEIGIELHSGKNRVIRRLFESMGYNVVKLDRVAFAGLTKKDLKRGHWRFLTPKEIVFLRMLK